MFKRKVVIFTFTGGFSLSFLIGFIAGNPFGVVFLRSLLSGIVVSGIGMAIVYVFNKYFAELKVNTGEGTADKEEREGIDIILPEENPHIIIDDNTIEEVEDVVEEMEEPQQVGEGKQEPMEEHDKAAETEPLAKEFVEGENVGSDELLPDLDSLAIDSVRTGRASVAAHKLNTEALGMETDPETLAKAVRSFMKKDEEG